MIFFCLNSNGLQITDYTSLASYQSVNYRHSLTMLYCTVHVYVVIHFCDSMLSFRLEANLSSFCCLFKSVLPLKI